MPVGKYQAYFEIFCNSLLGTRGSSPSCMHPTLDLTWILLWCLFLMMFLCRLYDMGVITTKKSLVQLEKLSTASFCRRRLPVVMVRLRMAETIREAVTFVEQGHVRVGPETVTDPAFLVTRSMQDFITWVDTSKIKRKIMAYNDKLDDYDLLAG